MIANMTIDPSFIYGNIIRGLYLQLLGEVITSGNVTATESNAFD